MSAIPFVPRIDLAPYHVAEQVSPLIRRVIANNPSKFTYRGTGTYIVGTNDVVVIDPGPQLDSHKDALQRALENCRVVGIAVTHCHADHSPLSKWLAEETGAPRFAIGPHAQHPGYVHEDDSHLDPPEETSASHTDDEHDDDHKESIDTEFVPDIAVVDGETFISTPEFSLTAVATPGHTSNHMCVAFHEEHALFTGDHVMGWSTTVVSPPDGDMSDYMASLTKVIHRSDKILWPTHGGAITDPQPFLRAYAEHRYQRERQILHMLESGPQTIHQIVEVLYADVAQPLHKPARRSVWSHVRKLHDEGIVVAADSGEPRLLSTYQLVGKHRTH
jgi:glyoxylase-like metal-dependent hydrolase (beta-lactamase superfamily II)